MIMPCLLAITITEHLFIFFHTYISFARCQKVPSSVWLQSATKILDLVFSKFCIFSNCGSPQNSAPTGWLFLILEIMLNPFVKASQIVLSCRTLLFWIREIWEHNAPCEAMGLHHTIPWGRRLGVAFPKTRRIENISLNKDFFFFHCVSPFCSPGLNWYALNADIGLGINSI